MGPERSLRDQATEAMQQAIAARGVERHRLMDEALRLHRLAVADELRRDPSNLLAPDDEPS